MVMFDVDAIEKMFPAGSLRISVNLGNRVPS